MVIKDSGEQKSDSMCTLRCALSVIIGYTYPTPNPTSHCDIPNPIECMHAFETACVSLQPDTLLEDFNLQFHMITYLFTYLFTYSQ